VVSFPPSTPPDIKKGDSMDEQQANQVSIEALHERLEELSEEYNKEMILFLYKDEQLKDSQVVLNRLMEKINEVRAKLKALGVNL